MANATPNYSGQINNANAVDALFLKVFAGEVLTAFEETNVMMSRHMVRSISSGKSAQFPIIGKASVEFHTMGAEIVGGAIPHNERIITIDDKIISNVFIPDLDEAKNHYDVRGPYSTAIGRALALQLDQHCLQQGVLAARETTPNYTGGPVGGVVEEAVLNDFDDPDKLAAALYDAAALMDANDVPSEDRYCFLPPARYYKLVQSEKAINRDFNVGNNGSYAQGNVFEVAGIEIVKTNNLPTTNITAADPDAVVSGTGDKYIGDFRITRGLVMQKAAIGTVKLMDLAMEAEYDMRRQGYLMLGKYAVGHGILRPECAIELQQYVA